MAGHRGRGRPHRRPHGGHGYGPPFGPGFGGFGPRGQRARRGDVRAALLVLLAEEPRNGYGLMQEIEARSNGA
ncbi:MAG TPA: PadR family transcriptional regulator, partial [Microbacterium sp.]|nr:PadR family transcriptional regulator [Microbacterium sp.]